MESIEQINPKYGNRKYRRQHFKKTGQMIRGKQDWHEPTKKVVFVKYTKKSRNGVEYQKYGKQLQTI